MLKIHNISNQLPNALINNKYFGNCRLVKLTKIKTMLADIGRKKLVMLVVGLVAVGLIFKAAKEKSPTTSKDSNKWDIHIYEVRLDHFHELSFSWVFF